MASVSRPALRSDETGNTFGTFTVLSYAGAKRGKACWNVECKCGFTTTALGRNLRRNILPRHACTFKICEKCGRSSLEAQFNNKWRDGSLCVECKKEYIKEWRKQNSGHVKQHLQKWHTDHPENVAKHRIAERKRIQSDHKIFLRYMLLDKIRRHKHIEQSTDSRTRQKANKLYKYIITIDAAYLYELWDAQGGLCALSKMPMLHEFHNPRSVSIDRIDGKLGYVPGNVQLVCQWVNLAKNKFSNEQILAVLNEFKS